MPNKGPRGNPSPKAAVVSRQRAAVIKRAALGAALAFMGAAESVGAATVTSTWKAGVTGNWNDSTKWTNSPTAATFPNNGNLGNTYDVVVNSGTATLNVPITVHSLTLSGGNILQPGAPAGTNAISLTGGLTFNAGQLNVPVTVPSGGTFTIGSGGIKLGATLSTGGPVAFAGAGPYQVNAAAPQTTWKILPTGTLALDRTLKLWSPIADPFGPTVIGTLENSGTITPSSGAVLDGSVGWAIRNLGTVRVPGTFELKAYGFASYGLLDLTTASSALTVSNFEIFETHLEGSVRIAAGATINFASGGVAVSNTSWTNSGTVNFNGQLHAISPSTVPGVLTFATNTAGILADAPLTLSGPVTFDAGLIAGTSRVTAPNLTFKAGGIKDAELFVPAGSTLTLSGTASRTIQRLGRLTVAGTLNWLGGGFTAGSVTNRINVTPGATL